MSNLGVPKLLDLFSFLLLQHPFIIPLSRSLLRWSTYPSSIEPGHPRKSRSLFSLPSCCLSAFYAYAYANSSTRRFASTFGAVRLVSSREELEPRSVFRPLPRAVISVHHFFF